MKGLVHYQEGDNDKARQYFAEALRVDPDHKKSQLLLKRAKELEKKKTEGNDAFQAQDYQTAYDRYTEALAIDPDNTATNAKLYSNRATVGSKLSKYKESIADCDKAIELDPNFFKVYLRRADLYTKTEQFEKAVHDYEKARELEPGNNEVKSALKDAKVRLKKAQRKDYYKILEIERSANEDEIKKAYRKMALKYHPGTPSLFLSFLLLFPLFSFLFSLCRQERRRGPEGRGRGRGQVQGGRRGLLGALRSPEEEAI